MQRTAVLLTAILVAMTAAPAGATLLIHYDGPAATQSSTTAAYDYQDTTTNATLYRINFTESLIYTNGVDTQAQAAGGVISYNQETTLLGMRGPGGYAPYAGRWMQRSSGHINDGGTYGGVETVMVWPQALFLNGGDAATVSLDATSSLSAVLPDYTYTDSSAMGFHFVVKDAGTYYYSQSSWSGSAGTFTVSDPTTELWAVWNPLSDPTDFMPTGSESFATRTFSNLQAVGLLVDSKRSQYAMNAMVTDFQVDAVIIPDPTCLSLLALGGVALLRRRRASR